MFNLDNITNENNIDHDKKWPYILDHPYGMLLVGGSGSERKKIHWLISSNTKTVSILLARLICVLKAQVSQKISF